MLQPATLLNVTFLHECISCFLNYTNGTKSRKALQIINVCNKKAICYTLNQDLSIAEQWMRTDVCREQYLHFTERHGNLLSGR